MSDSAPGKSSIESQIGEKMQSWMQMHQEIAELRKEWRASWSAAEAPAVEDYSFKTFDGELSLSDLFGEHDDLIVVHNMGRGCSYCTLWADGFIGLRPHLESRAGFAISSPDDPATQATFAEGRGWPFRMVSLEGNRFAQDMGFADDEGNHMPGYSTFRRDASGRIVRVGKDFFGPGDAYCGIWHMLDHLAEGPDGWHPRFDYAAEGSS